MAFIKAVFVLVIMGLAVAYLYRSKFPQLANLRRPLNQPAVVETSKVIMPRPDNIQRAKVTLKADPANAEYEINGVPRGNLPAEMLMPINTQVKLQIKQVGYKTKVESFTVTGNKDLNIKLEKLAGQPKASPLRSNASVSKKATGIAKAPQKR